MLKIRIGVATGIVVVGDLVGPGFRARAGRRRRHAQSRRAVASARRAGRSPNRGSPRLNGAAGRDLLRTGGARPAIVEGFRRAPAAALGCPTRGGNTSAGSRRRGRAAWTPFVGREHEVALLRGALARSVRGAKARSCSCRGEVRHRQVSAFWRRCASGSALDPHSDIAGFQCSPHHVNDAFYPVASHHPAMAAGFRRRSEPASARLDKLEAT